MTLIYLALIGAVEAVVYQGRYRATHGSPWAAGGWTCAVCFLRVLFVVAGVGAMMGNERVVPVMLAYGLPAAIVTGLVRARERKAVGK